MKRSRLWQGWFLALCALLVSGIAPAQAQFGLPDVPKDVVTVRPVAPTSGIKASAKSTLTLELKILEPFHINANPASEDYLIPTEASVKAAPGLKIGKPIYPKPVLKKFGFYEGMLKVYEGTVQIKVPLETDGTFKPTSLEGTLKYQACNDQACLAPKTLEWKLKLDGTAPPAPKPPIKNPPIIDKSTGTAVGTTTVDNNENRPASGATASNDADAVQLRERFGVKGLPTLVFVGANGEARADLRAGEELSLAGMTQKMDALKSGQQLNVDEDSAAGWAGRLKSASIWWQIGLVFIGGLLLNLTPCVYLMIPITIGYFGAQSEGKTGKTFSLALLYVLGLALVYSTLGVFAAFTGNLFGSLMQSSWVIGFVAIIFFALSLSMMGVFTLNPPQALMQQSGAKKGALGALAMGALLGIVAAPCVGPVVAALLAYVGARGEPLLGFILFFALSIGLGVPYLLLGTFSGAVKSLPRSGMWLEKSKKFFAIPLLIVSFYYAYLAVKPALAAPIEAAPAGQHWTPATLAKLDEAKQKGQPVILDFRADWCLPCLKMEREIFSQAAVHQAAAANDIQLLQVDLTSQPSD